MLTAEKNKGENPHELEFDSFSLPCLEQGEGEQGDKGKQLVCKISRERLKAAQMDEAAQIPHVALEGKESTGIGACLGVRRGGEGTKKIFFYHAYFKINFL